MFKAAQHSGFSKNHIFLAFFIRNSFPHTALTHMLIHTCTHNLPVTHCDCATTKTFSKTINL